MSSTERIRTFNLKRMKFLLHRLSYSAICWEYLTLNLYIFYTPVLDLSPAFRCFSGERMKCAGYCSGFTRISLPQLITRFTHKGFTDFFFASSRQFIPVLLSASAFSVLPLSSNSANTCRCKQLLSSSISCGPRLSGGLPPTVFLGISHDNRFRWPSWQNPVPIPELPMCSALPVELSSSFSCNVPGPHRKHRKCFLPWLQSV